MKLSFWSLVVKLKEMLPVVDLLLSWRRWRCSILSYSRSGEMRLKLINKGLLICLWNLCISVHGTFLLHQPTTATRCSYPTGNRQYFSFRQPTRYCHCFYFLSRFSINHPNRHCRSVNTARHNYETPRASINIIMSECPDCIVPASGMFHASVWSYCLAGSQI